LRVTRSAYHGAGLVPPQRERGIGGPLDIRTLSDERE
jgi:hypothetical protein